MAVDAPEVSFVATVYNKRRFIPLLVASIRSQRGLSDDCEYIFVDDGSTDGSFELLQDLTRGLPNLKIIQKENGGQTSAINVGLRMATKPYIKLWDADDYAHPDITLTMIKAMQTHKTDLVYTDIDTWDFDNPDDPDAIVKALDKTQIVHDSKVIDDPQSLVHRRPMTNPTGLMITRALLNQIGLMDERISIPDIYLVYTASLFTKFALIPGLYVYAFHDVPGRLTANTAQILHDLNGALYCLYDNFEKLLSYKWKRHITSRAAGRAWKWDHRHNKVGILSASYWRFIKTRISPFLLSREEMYQTLLPFRESGNIRVKF